jgi:hypothetical protein
VTGYGLDGPGIESRWGARFSAPVQTCPGAHPASCTMGTGSFRGVKRGRGVTLTPHPLLVPWSWKGTAIPLLPRMGRSACTEPQCLYQGALYLYLLSPIYNFHVVYRIQNNHHWIISYHIVSYHIISYIIYHISYRIVSYRIISYLSYRIVSYHIISYILSYHTISYHIISALYKPSPYKRNIFI